MVTAKFDLTLNEQLSGSVKHHISLDKLHLKYQQFEEQAKLIEWQGNAKLDHKDIDLTGSLNILNSQFTDNSDVELTQHFEQLTLNTELKLNTAEHIVLFAKHDLSVENLEVNFEQFKEKAKNITWVADIDLNNQQLGVKGALNIKQSQLSANDHTHLMQSLELLTLNTDAQLNIENSLFGSIKHQLNIDNFNVNYHQVQQKAKQIVWSGNTQLKDSNISVTGDLEINKNQITELNTSALLQQFDTLIIKNVSYGQEETTFDQLHIKNLSLLKNQNDVQLLNLASFDINKFSLSSKQNKLSINTIDMQQPMLDATLSKDKQLTHLALLEPVIQRFSSTENEPKKQSETKASPLSINIKKVTLSKPGEFKFTDQSVAPIYTTTLSINSLQLDNISNQNEGKLSLQLEQLEYAKINIKGDGLLLNPAKRFTFDTNITQLDLPPISSYSAAAIGYGIKSGVVDTTIKGELKNNIIDSHVKLKLDSIQVIEVDKETAEHMASSSGMSIELALSTLTDDENIIDLEVPIKGDINNPDFDLNLVINKALGEAMKSGTMSYLKHSLQPFGTLLTLYSLLESAVNHISLAPVVFQPNSTALDETQIELLGKVTNILKERPALKIKACGVSSLADEQAITKALTLAAKQAQTEQKQKSPKGKKANEKKEIMISKEEVLQKMTTLADKRSATVKAYFIKKEKLKPSRILKCLSNTNTKKDSKPVVELLI
ncbi:MAG: DUF748 domain-containing protein [Gammaproteobacteria bacterium]|nr:DUF748 domain-containing protein [Gammaproteobacteria bacterium]